MTLDPTAMNRTLPGPELGRDLSGIPFPEGSSERWIVLMARALAKRRARFDELETYYRGHQDNRKLATAAWHRLGLSRVFPRLNANHSRLIVKAAIDRLGVLGFRLEGELDADTEAWRIWRANDMEALSRQAHVEALVKGECPVLVEPDNRDASTPRLTPQDPSEVIVWHESGDRRLRVAALKTWLDQWTRRRMFTLYLTDRIERWQERRVGAFETGMWSEALEVRPDMLERRERGNEPFQLPNPLGEVPIVVLPNDPRLTGAPEGEHEVVLPLIDLYTKTLMDMAVTSHELAFPRTYATGVDQDDEEPVRDAVTGEVIVDAPARIRTGQDQMIILRDPEGKVGQLSAASLEGYVNMLETLRGEIATVTFRPYHYVLNMPSSVPPSGESITAAEAPFADNVRGHALDLGTPWRHLVRLAFRIAGDEPRARAMATGHVIWADPERRTESQHVDALGKSVEMLRLPIEAAWERLPASPQDIARWKRMGPPPAATAPPGLTGQEV